MPPKINPTDEAYPPIIYAAIRAKCSDMATTIGSGHPPKAVYLFKSVWNRLSSHRCRGHTRSHNSRSPRYDHRSQKRSNTVSSPFLTVHAGELVAPTVDRDLIERDLEFSRLSTDGAASLIADYALDVRAALNGYNAILNDVIHENELKFVTLLDPLRCNFVHRGDSQHRAGRNHAH